MRALGATVRERACYYTRMRKTIAPAILLVLCQATPGFAWGFAAHRFILARAIEVLPSELRPFFQRHQAELLIRVSDPDVWRDAGWEDDPNHFLNFGVDEYGAYPFAALPREYGAAIEKFGTQTLRRNGLLPWRLAEEFGNLRRAFSTTSRASGRGADRGGPGNIVLFAAVAAHYMQDAYQPLHAIDNYDGQLSGNRGIHARFERDLFARYESRVKVDPPARVRAMTNVRDAAFEALLSGYQAVGPLLRADTEALGGRRTYDDQYFEKFFVKVQPMLEERLSAAATATAALIVGAWEQAGRPRL